MGSSKDSTKDINHIEYEKGFDDAVTGQQSLVCLGFESPSYEHGYEMGLVFRPLKMKGVVIQAEIDSAIEKARNVVKMILKHPDLKNPENSCP